jgi:Tol biopolymer transport system component/predicted Ser/Thr protein kinase
MALRRDTIYRGAMNPQPSIAHYRITSKLGAGGMGEVYRAVDTRLGRDVAIKVLPPAFAEDPARMQRFEREAQVLATLNHPNIASIYGVEQNAIVMELVAGDDLKGLLPIETAVAYARQIAMGLEAAHEKGVVHRDLKPANIKVTAEGTIKILDFGLAKAAEPSPDSSAGSPTVSPTLSLEMTRAGMILGTAAYMAPEQAKGAAVDKRADIWSFGVVVMEMLTGASPFRGDTVSDTLADVLRAPIDFNALPADTPPAVRRLLERCLERDPKRRLRDIGEARILLSDPGVLAPAPVPVPRRSPRVWAAVVLAAVASAAIAIAAYARFRPSPTAPVTRLSIPLPAGQVLTGGAPALSRDGRLLAYVARGATGVARLYVRPLDRYAVAEIPDSDGAQQPFFSPDGARVGFFARAKLWVASVQGGAPLALADTSYIPVGASWGEGDTIYYTPALSSGIFRVPASGGKSERLTEPDEAANGYAHVWPQYIAETRAVLFTIWGGLNMEANGAMLLTPGKPGGTRVAATVKSARYAGSGHLLISGAHGIMAAPLDARKPAETRPNSFVLDDVFSSPNINASWFSVSDNGTLAYVPGDPSLSTLEWIDRSGTVTPITDQAQTISDPALSPDGERLTYADDMSLWQMDLRRGTRTRLTFDGDGANQMASWSHDGARIVFASNRSGDWDIYSISPGGGAPQRLLARKGAQFPTSVAPDGTVLFNERSRETGFASDLWTVDRNGKAAPFYVSRSGKISGEFSPDGRLVAYVSDESGRYEVYLRSIARPADAIPVSSDGGMEPRWSPDGKELFYRRGDAFFAVPVGAGEAPRVGESRKLFEVRAAMGRYLNHAGYAVSPDGRRFLIQRLDARAIPTQIHVILNWFDELRAKVPAR